MYALYVVMTSSLRRLNSKRGGLVCNKLFDPVRGRRDCGALTPGCARRYSGLTLSGRKKD